MKELLSLEGYEQTKEKLRDLETRLAEIEKRTDLDADHLVSVRRSYKMMMREYLQDIKLYEARYAKPKPMARPKQWMSMSLEIDIPGYGLASLAKRIA